MANNTMRKVKWFWSWQDEREEAWLAALARQGWHLSALPFPLVYEFAAGEPRDDIYRLDYQHPAQKALGDYEQLFRDAGWELVGRSSGWHYFRKSPAPGELAEIYTDVESKIAKYQRLTRVLVGVFAPQIAMFVIFMGGLHRRGVFVPVLFAIYFAFIAAYVITVLGLIRRMNQLKAQRGAA